MITKRGLYHKKCFSCISCRCQLHYYGAIEGPDDEIYCRVCYLKAYGPGGKNKYGDATPYPVEDEEAPDCCIRCGSKVKWHFLAIKTLEIDDSIVLRDPLSMMGMVFIVTGKQSYSINWIGSLF